MGTGKVIFEGDRGGSDNCACLIGSDVTGSDRKMPFGSMFCAWATGSCAISALVGPFSPEVTVTWPEETLSGLTTVFFPVLFSPYFFPRTFFPVLFFSVLFFSVLFFFVLFSPYFFYPYFCPRTFFSRIFFFFTFFPYFFPLFFFLYFFSRTFFLPYYLFPVLFQKSWRLKSNVLKYQWLFFLVHNTVVITQFMFLAEYSFKRHP